MKNIFTIIILFSLFFSIVGCIQKTSATTSSTSQKEKNGPKPEMAYYIDKDGDGIFEEIVPEEVPIPFGGKDEFNQKLASLYKYPASARENGISGFVVLNILVDEFGFVQEVNIKKSLSRECDDAIINAFRNATTNGYAALQWEGVNVKYRMDYPFEFSLQ